ncbi:pyridoxamine 5'-phosphate oxidase family protein [Mycolicibacterium sp.]|uniref:pyridoxamine 5'-phosphate oxidase family protein n=1 Tax=Mycolicibacterium sp. TaxID=2320850 RepID=UPI001A2DDFBE|nr:pyridoxamine 5'-phosphate oxidase family protein [Mycolicibacterium sp.]MBJ7339214.1 pyridoxamine 5'-phosphate oxidase family protein [Mycolicibacterium sp.]
MTTLDANSVDELTDQDSWNLLDSVALGRLATSVADRPEIFPVNFAVQQHTILLRTAEGTKLLHAMSNGHVAFEVDGYNAEQGWSVVVKGRAYVLGASELAEAERGQVLPWTTTFKDRFIRIVPTEISGRRFRFEAKSE